jgi:hypothetical protein
MTESDEGQCDWRHSRTHLVEISKDWYLHRADPGDRHMARLSIGIRGEKGVKTENG